MTLEPQEYRQIQEHCKKANIELIKAWNVLNHFRPGQHDRKIANLIKGAQGQIAGAGMGAERAIMEEEDGKWYNRTICWGASRFLGFCDFIQRGGLLEREKKVSRRHSTHSKITGGEGKAIYEGDDAAKANAIWANMLKPCLERWAKEKGRIRNERTIVW